MTVPQNARADLWAVGRRGKDPAYSPDAILQISALLRNGRSRSLHLLGILFAFLHMLFYVICRNGCIKLDFLHKAW